ncbi:MAG: tryptophan-rich sensory protein [Ruminococcus flavefaciens]|nr:tryptophan-rich sensory protein [Ruminococcus flavefaciens]MCM1229674.1 tryptophan-rich sensory protein [Ruminococcus flavefaciens]
MKKANLTDLLIFIVSAELIGAVSALLAGSFKDFYAEIIRPPFSPPSWVFPVVWAVLYALMGISSYMIYISRGALYKEALAVYAIQLAVNFSWSIIFFRFRLLGTSAVVAILLAVLVAIMVYMFAKIRKTAGLINIPYLLWSIFAAYLSIGTVFLNNPDFLP